MLCARILRCNANILKYNGAFSFSGAAFLNSKGTILNVQKLNAPQQNFKCCSTQSTTSSFTQFRTDLFLTMSNSTPVEYVQNLLLNIHELTGFSWWLSIISTTVLLRTCITLPFAVYQRYIIAKLENIKLEMPAIIEELRKETAIAIKMFNWDDKTARLQYNISMRKQWNNLIVRDNCHPFKSSLLVLFQIPLWVSLSIGLRNLVYMLPSQSMDAQLTFLQLSVGGFGWIPNLTVPDSSYILPVALGLINLSIIEIQTLSRTTEATKMQKVLTNFFRGLTIFMVPIAASVPSCLVVYWTTSSSYGLLQNLALLSPKVKRFCHIPTTKNDVEHPYQLLLQNSKLKIKKISDKFK